MKKIEFDCLEIKQPIGQFYMGVMNWDDLLAISEADVRRLVNKEREIENYMGIQRPLNINRSKEIGQYTNLSDACFPTGVLLAISSDNAEFDNKNKKMYINNEPSVAKVLDGQHRIAGLQYFNKKGEEFQINVSIFIDMELEDQAIVFATINSTHEKVSPSLAADLYEFSTRRSPQKTAHNIVKALNEKQGSPFKDKIKILGTADDKIKETITQSTFVNGILKYMTKNKAIDRDAFRRGGKPQKYSGGDLNLFFLRNLFINDQDGEIAKIIWNYFKAVEMRWPNAWLQVQPNLILNRSNGFVALMNFLRDAYLNIVKSEIGKVPSVPEFLSIFERISLKDEDFTKDNFVPGSSGRAALYKRFKGDSKI